MARVRFAGGGVAATDDELLPPPPLWLRPLLPLVFLAFPGDLGGRPGRLFPESVGVGALPAPGDRPRRGFFGEGCVSSKSSAPAPDWAPLLLLVAAAFGLLLDPGGRPLFFVSFGAAAVTTLRGRPRGRLTMAGATTEDDATTLIPSATTTTRFLDPGGLPRLFLVEGSASCVAPSEVAADGGRTSSCVFFRLAEADVEVTKSLSGYFFGRPGLRRVGEVAAEVAAVVAAPDTPSSA
jgi:hypothetical protein